MSAGSRGDATGDEKTIMWTDPNETYLLGRVPDNVLDVLRVRVHNCNTFILVFFIHCRAERDKVKYINRQWRRSVSAI